MKTNISNASSAETPVSTITGIEILCLKFTAEGRTPGEIGFALGLEVSVIDKHLLSVQDKLSAENRMHAVLIALRNELLKSAVDLGQ